MVLPVRLAGGIPGCALIVATYRLPRRGPLSLGRVDSCVENIHSRLVRVVVDHTGVGRFVTELLESEGWQVQSVETENRGFDLIARKPHLEDPQTAIDVRFIEVKGRAAVGEVILSDNEYRTAVRLKKDYWLYAVFNCATKPQAHIVRDPARLGWEPIIMIEHYHLDAARIQ